MTPTRRRTPDSSTANSARARGVPAGPNAGPGAWVDRPAQIRALASAARQEIVDTLESAGPLTMAELAALLDRPADALYFHVRRLVRVGLVRECGSRRDGRHIAAVYDVAARPVRMSYADPAPAKAVGAVIASALRTATREFAAAVEDQRRDLPGPGRPKGLWGARVKGWLTPDESARVGELLEQAVALVRAGRPREGTRPVALSFVLAPTVRSARVTGGDS